MATVGKTDSGATAASAAVDELRVASFEVFVPARVATLAVLADGLDGGNGTALLRGVGYLDGELSFATVEGEVDAGSPPGWVPLRISAPGGALLEPGTWDIGVQVGGDAGVLRLYGDADAGAGKVAAASYADGPASTFPGGATVPDFDLSAFASIFPGWATRVSPTRDPFYVSRLPFAEAQATLAAASAGRAGRTLTVAGWHGTKLDPERGSFAIVRSDGPFGGLVGRRLRIETVGAPRRRTGYAFVHSEADIVEDLSFTRRLFQHFATLGRRHVLVSIETADGRKK